MLPLKIPKRQTVKIFLTFSALNFQSSFQLDISLTSWVLGVCYPVSDIRYSNLSLDRTTHFTENNKLYRKNIN